MKRVLVTSFYNRQAVAPAIERLRQGAEVVLCNEGRQLSEEQLIAHLPGVDAVIATDERYSERVFAAAPQLKMIALDGVGFDNVDLAAATRHGVIVNNAPVNYDSVADLAFGLMIATVRKILVGDRGMRSGRWGERDAYLTPDVNGAILGIIGLGRVGRAVARRAVGFDLTLLAYDPYVSPEAARPLGVQMVDLAELLSQADIITIHMPLNPETRGMINGAAFARMKRGAYLINTSRGAIVDEPALIAALASGHLAGAGLDVVCDEPPTPDNPLFRFDNVVLTAHVGSDTLGTFRKIFDSAVTDLLLFFDGQRPRNVVNPAVLG